MAPIDRRPTSVLLAMQDWTPTGRFIVFSLSATSIWCLLVEMYGLVSMRAFFWTILLPSNLAMYGAGCWDAVRGGGRLWRAIVIGTLGGLAAAVAYDVFRLPFVYSSAWNLEGWGIPQMPLFKVFPRFGALILGEPLEQGGYSTAAHGLGWAYHFSNGATFGVMYVALIGEAGHRGIGGWPWAVLLALGIEACLLISPYASFFGITVTRTFVVATLLAHLVFGAALGLYVAWHSRRWAPAHSTASAPSGSNL